MDQVAQLAQVAQEQLLSAWAMLGPVSSKASEAFVLAGKQMEPLQSTVMAAQVGQVIGEMEEGEEVSVCRGALAMN